MIPNDPLYKDQWHLQVLDMEKVWDIELGEPGVLVAVVEAGFDVEHPDLVNRIQRTINLSDHPDTMSAEGRPEAESATDHGTHMLGLIGAEMNNGEGGVGVAPGCNLLPVKISNPSDDDHIAQAIRAAVDEGARVINLSDVGYYELGKQGVPILPRQSGPPRTDVLLDACAYAVNHDVLISSVVAGNQGFFSMVWPAAYHPGLNVIQGNVEGTGPANFCAINEYADVLSPGGDRAPSGDADWPWGDHPDISRGLMSTVQVKNGSYRFWSGGCMSTAVASGVAALMYSRFPDLGVEQARQVICNTARGEGWSREGGHGYINPLGIMTLDRVECDLEISDVAFDGKNVTVTVANRGVLDARDLLVLVYCEEPDTPKTRQVAHKPLPLVPGMESARMTLEDVALLPGTDELWVVVDTKRQLSAAQREAEVYSLRKCVPT